MKFLKFNFKNHIHFFFIRPKKVRQNIADWKVMLIVAFYQDRILSYQVLPKNTNVNGEVFYLFLSDYVWPSVHEYAIHKPIILMDNAKPHYHEIVMNFLVERKWEILEHPAYSPDMNPCDFDGIARIKRPLKGIRFTHEAELKEALKLSIDGINTRGEFKGMKRLYDQWNDIMRNDGNYNVD